MNFIKKVFYGNKINNLLFTGHEHLEDENYFSAITFFSHVLEINKNNEEALNSRANAYLSLKNYEKAISDLEHLEKVNPSFNTKIDYLLSGAYLSLNKTSKSAEYAYKYYSNNSEDAQAQYFAARAKYFNGNYDEALKLTDLLLAKDYDDFNIRYLRSLILFAQNNFVSAILDIDKAIEINSLNGFAFNLRGLINIQLLNYEEAVEDFDYAIRLEPANAVYYFNRSKTQLKIGEVDEAQLSIMNSLELDPKNKSSYLLKAQINLAEENYTGALDEYLKASKIDPNDIKLLKTIADLKIYLSDFKGAKDDLNNIIEIDKASAELYYKLAFIEFRLGDEEAVLTNLTKAIKLNPEHIEALMQKGIIEFLNKNYEESIEMFDRLIKIDNDLAKARHFKIRALIKLGRFEEAGEELSNIEEKTNDYEYMLLNSQVSYHNENLDKAQQSIDDCIDLGEENLTIHLVNNILKTKQGNYDNLKEIADFQFENENKVNSQILNAIISFEKGQYNSAKYRLSNLANLDEVKLEKIKPLLDYVETRLS